MNEVVGEKKKKLFKTPENIFNFLFFNSSIFKLNSFSYLLKNNLENFTKWKKIYYTECKCWGQLIKNNRFS